MNYRKIVALLIITCLLFSSINVVNGDSTTIPAGLTDLTKNCTAKISVEQAIVIIMARLNISPFGDLDNADINQDVSPWAETYIKSAYLKGWLPSEIPKLSSFATKAFVDNFFLNCLGYHIYQTGLSNEQQSGLNSALTNFAVKVSIINGSNSSLLNATSSKTDITKLYNTYKAKTLGWNFRSMGWILYSSNNLDAASIVFKICADAGPGAGTTPADCADAYYGYGAIMSHSSIRNYFSASVYLNKAVLISPSSKSGISAVNLLKKLPPVELGNDYMPDKPISYEELLSMYANNLYFKIDSTPKDYVIKDKGGNLPSDWSRKYVNYIYYKGLAPSVPDSFSSPAPRWWIASFSARVKFLSNFDYDRYYTFDDLDNLVADDKMYINIAVDRNLFPMPQSSLFDPDGTILRKDLPDLVNRSRNIGQPHKAVYTKTSYDKMVDTFYCDNGILHFTYENGVIDKRHDSINMVDFGAVYYSPDDPHKTPVDEGTKYIKTRLPLTNNNNQPILDGIAECKQYNIKAMIDFSLNGSRAYNIIKDEARRNDIINDLVHLNDLYGMDGVSLCFEHMPPEARQSFSLLAEGLSERLKPEGKLLTVIVGAYSSDKYEAKSAYDLALLGKICDYVKVVLYDDFPVSSYPKTGQDGPISRLDWNERILKYTVQKVPARKLLMGIGNMCIDFNVTNKKDADLYSLADVSTVIAKAKAGSVKYFYDNTTQSPYLEYKDNSGNLHRLWYENKKSYSLRMDQVHKYGLGGIFFYWVGSDSQDFYDAIYQDLR